jgi:hypothetical protein
MSRQPLPDREWVIVYPRRIVGGLIAGDAITDNDMGLADLEPQQKDRLQEAAT